MKGNIMSLLKLSSISLLLCTLVSCNIMNVTRVPKKSEKLIVSIVNFGALSNGSLQTEKIQAAIDYCFKNGGGEVVVPTGEYLTGGIRLRSNITLHLMENAVLKGSRNPRDYLGYLDDSLEPIDKSLITDASWSPATTPNRITDHITLAGSRWNSGLIKAIHADNVAIIGEKGSSLDGQNCYDELGEEHYRGPHCINMHYCHNITLRGYTVKDSANWAHAIFFSDNILVENVTVLAGHDGVDLRGCDNVKIINSKFLTGDDCVAGQDNHSILVRNCELNSACSAIRFGGRDVLFDNCHIYGPSKYYFRGSLSKNDKISGVPVSSNIKKNMLSVFTYYSDYSLNVRKQPGDITIRNCQVENVDRFLHYNFSGNEPWQKNKPLKNIRFENIKATGISFPLNAYGTKQLPITIELVNIDFSFREGFEASDFMHVCHFDKITLKNVTVNNYKGKAFIKTWSDDRNLEIENLNCDVQKDRLLITAEEKYVCNPI